MIEGFITEPGPREKIDDTNVWFGDLSDSLVLAHTWVQKVELQQNPDIIHNAKDAIDKLIERAQMLKRRLQAERVKGARQ